MNRGVLLLVVALAFLCDRIAAMEWKLCADGGPFEPDTVVLSPDPPQIGQDISFDIEGAYDHGAHCWFCSGCLVGRICAHLP